MSRLKNLLFGNRNSKSNLRGSAYDSAVSRDPPVKGSYPVAGNGPNVLDQIQQSKAKREARRQSEAATAPIVPRYREPSLERPRTAGHNEQRRGSSSIDVNGRRGSNATDIGREKSKFSMKSPPTFFSSSRRNSLPNTNKSAPPIPNEPIPSQNPKLQREIQTYQPRKAIEAEQYNSGGGGFVPPFVTRHNRADSQTSHRSHVDLLEAHSNIKNSREASRHRVRASGVRNYGEDVADRNLALEREPRLDLNSPEFSYLKTVYSPKKRSTLSMDGHSRNSSAWGHVLGHDQNISDDIQPHRHSNTTPIRSARPGQSPYRTNSPSVYSFSTNGGRDDDRSTYGDLAPEGRRALSPLSTTSSVQDHSIQESRLRETLRQPGSTSDRGRQTQKETPLTVPDPKQPMLSKVFSKKFTSTPRVAHVPENKQAIPRTFKGPPPVAPPGELSSFIPQAPAPTPAPAAAPEDEGKASNSNVKQRKRTMSSASQTTTTNNHTPRGSYSVFPSSSERSSSTSPTSPPVTKRSGTAIAERAEPISLEGVVDLTNTVDTEVITKTLPAVTQEHITPTQHSIREERITREIHNHDFYYRTLPVIETKILPTKHYIKSDDLKSLIEIPEAELHKYVPNHSVTGKPNGNWSISKEPRSRGPSLSQSIYSHTNTNDQDGAEGPVIGLARGEPRTTRSRANSRASTNSHSHTREPVLASKKEYITPQGYPKTEYVWRHPPAFQDSLGRTQPVYIGAGIGNISSPLEPGGEAGAYLLAGGVHVPEPGGYAEDDDQAGASFGAERSPVFRDGGYGAAGMLPGISAQGSRVGGPRALNSNSKSKQKTGGDVIGERISTGKGAGREEQMARAEVEANKALRRMNEGRGGGVMGVSGVEKGMESLSV